MSRLIVDLRGAGGPLTPVGAYARHLAAGLDAVAGAAGHSLTMVESGRPPAGDILILPGGGTPSRRLPTAACIPDLAYLMGRRQGPLAAVRTGIRTAFTAHRADLVFVPTPAVGEAVQRYLRARTPLVVPPAVAAGFTRSSATAAQAAARQMGIEGRYVVAAGDPALARRVWAAGQLDAELVVLEERPPGDLAGLLSGAVALLALDRANGCPMLALLAMACGCPPVAASDGAYRDLVRDAGLVADPDQPGEWVECVAALLRSRSLRSQLSRQGLDMAAGAPATGSAETLLGGLAPLMAATAARAAAR